VVGSCRRSARSACPRSACPLSWSPSGALSRESVATHAAPTPPTQVLSGLISEPCGRRVTFIVAAVLFIVGCLVESVARTYTELMIGMMFWGTACGIGTSIDPMYIGEIVQSEHRGFFVTWSEVSICIGQLLGFSTGWVLSYLSDSKSFIWRTAALSGIIGPVLMILGAVYVLPESPRWLLTKGRAEEAKAILVKEFGNDSVEADKIVRVALSEVSEMEKDNDRSMVTFIMSKKSPAVRRMLLVGIGAAVAQQTSGIDPILYNAILSLEKLGFRSLSTKYTILTALGIAKLCTALVSMRLLDRVGRRPIMLTSSCGMIASLLSLAVVYATLGQARFTDSTTAKIFGVFFFVTTIVSFELGLGPGCWLLPSEIFYNSIRTRGVALATLANRAMSTAMILGGLNLLDASSWFVYFASFAALNVFGLAFFAIYLPETANRTLEDMYAHFERVTTAEAEAADDYEKKRVLEAKPADASTPLLNPMT